MILRNPDGCPEDIVCLILTQFPSFFVGTVSGGNEEEVMGVNTLPAAMLPWMAVATQILCQVSSVYKASKSVPCGNWPGFSKCPDPVPWIGPDSSPIPTPTLRHHQHSQEASRPLLSSPGFEENKIGSWIHVQAVGQFEAS